MSITDELREYAHDCCARIDDDIHAIADRIDAAVDGMVELPKDADGEYIRIGDEVETTNFGTVEVEGFVHRAVAFYNYSEQPAYLCTTPANLCRHHHTPTVEDVLREMLFRAHIYDKREMELLPDLIADYAAKLRLVEGEDE